MEVKSAGGGQHNGGPISRRRAAPWRVNQQQGAKSVAGLGRVACFMCSCAGVCTALVDRTGVVLVSWKFQNKKVHPTYHEKLRLLSIISLIAFEGRSHHEVVY